MPEELVFMIVAIVAICTIGSIFSKLFENKNRVSNSDMAEIRADLNDLKKNVEEMKEYITDLYIQQHDQRLK